MDKINYFEGMFESKPDYREIVLLIFLIQNDNNFLKEIGFSKNDIILYILEFKNVSIEGHADYLDYIKNEDESAIEKFLNK